MGENLVNRLRQQIFDFYSENDPAKLRGGLDVNGMAEWTERNGIKALNDLLLLQYQKQIDFTKDVGSATDQISRISNVFAPALSIKRQEGIKIATNNEKQASNNDLQAHVKSPRASNHLKRNSNPGRSKKASPQGSEDFQSEQYELEEKEREKLVQLLEEFYRKHDPSKLTDEGLNTLVEFAMFHGVKKLNYKLLPKYGEGISEAGFRDRDNELALAKRENPPLESKNSEVSESEDQDDSGHETDGEPHEEIDELKTKQELRIFYQKNDPPYLEDPENLDKVVALMKKVGRAVVEKRLFEFYGETMGQAIEEHKKKQEKLTMDRKKATMQRQQAEPGNIESNAPSSGEGGVSIDFDDILNLEDDLAGFDDIDKLRTDLEYYYKKHDPEEIGNIDDVIALGMEMGLAKLNVNMESFYGESLIEFLQNTRRVNAPIGVAGGVVLPGLGSALPERTGQPSYSSAVSRVSNRLAKSSITSPKPQPYSTIPPPVKLKDSSSTSFPTKKTSDEPLDDLPPPFPNRQNTSSTVLPAKTRELPELPSRYPAPIKGEAAALKSEPPKVPSRPEPSPVKVETIVMRNETQPVNLDPEMTNTVTSSQKAPKIPVRLSPTPHDHMSDNLIPKDYSPPLPKRGESVADTKKKDKTKGVSKKSETRRVEDAEEVLRNKLKKFYIKHDPTRLETMDSIMNLANSIGEKELNNKLYEFYGEGLDTLSGSLSEVAEVKRQESNLDDPIQNKEKKKKKQEIPTTELSGFSANKPSRKEGASSRKGEDEEDAEAPSAVYVINDNDFKQLREDLVIYYTEFDREKLQALDQIVQLGEKIGRPQLNEKLNHLYGMGLNDYTIKMHQPEAAKNEKKKKKKKRKEHRNEELESAEERRHGPLLPKNVIQMPGLGESVNLKKTGLDLSKTLYTPTKSKTELQGVARMASNASKRTTQARAKLLSVDMASNGKNSFKPVKQTFVPMPVQTPYKRADATSVPKVPIHKIVAIEMVKDIENGPCNNYRLDMTGTSFGVCKCGYPRAKHGIGK